MLGIVEFLVKQKADLNRLDKSGWNVLAAAIRGRQPKVAQFLIANGANASQPNLGGRTALHEVVEVADMGTLAVLLKQGVFVDAQDVLDRTALHVAAANGSSEIVRQLLDAEASALPMRGGQFPLHLAAGKGGKDPECARLLLERRQHDVDALDRFGDSALLLASLHGNAETLRLMLQWCANVKVRNGKGRSALDYAYDSTITNLLLNAATVEGRCECDCGPYRAGAQFRTVGWEGGCRAWVVCQASAASGGKERLACRAGREGANSTWRPPAPGLNCPMAIASAGRFIPAPVVAVMAAFPSIAALLA